MKFDPATYFDVSEGECYRHVWKGDGTCPYCTSAELHAARMDQITKAALTILDAALKDQHDRTSVATSIVAP